MPTDLPAAWPPALAAFLAATHGPPAGIERLAGMSPAQVWRVRFAAGSVIVKGSPSPREALVYEHLGPTLRAAGVAMPERRWSAHLDGAHWLVLEDLPHPAPIQPPETWRPDGEMAALLARLHRLDLRPPAALVPLGPPAWTAAMDTTALTLFPVEVAPAVAASLRALRVEFEPLASPSGWLSGDPNPTNWGRRADGTLALFDWERLRRGPPAVDLAILVPGLGEPAQYRLLAQAYLAARPEVDGGGPGPPAALARAIALGKVQGVVEFLTLLASGEAHAAGRHRDWLRTAVPPWLTTLAGGA